MHGWCCGRDLPGARVDGRNNLDHSTGLCCLLLLLLLLLLGVCEVAVYDSVVSCESPFNSIYFVQLTVHSTEQPFFSLYKSARKRSMSDDHHHHHPAVALDGLAILT